MSRYAKKKPGQAFEEAVHAFIETLSEPPTRVIFNHKVCDVRSGKLRQVDVWIVTKTLGHFPLNIAVSCKDYGRPIDDTHVEKFHAELDAYGAGGGIIYARSGFCPGAVTLASKFGIACCMLWQDRPADVPTLKVYHYYCCYDGVSVPR